MLGTWGQGLAWGGDLICHADLHHPHPPVIIMKCRATVQNLDALCLQPEFGFFMKILLSVIQGYVKDEMTSKLSMQKST